MVEWCQELFTNKTNGKVFVNRTKTMIGQKGWTLYNEKWCFIQDEIRQQIKRCLSTIEAQRALKELHEKAAWQRFATKITQNKILDVGY